MVQGDQVPQILLYFHHFTAGIIQERCFIIYCTKICHLIYSASQLDENGSFRAFICYKANKYTAICQHHHSSIHIAVSGGTFHPGSERFKCPEVEIINLSNRTRITVPIPKISVRSSDLNSLWFSGPQRDNFPRALTVPVASVPLLVCVCITNVGRSC